VKEGGAVDEVSLSLKRLRGGPGGWASSPGTLEHILRKSLDAASLLAGAPLSSGTPICGGARISRIRIDE
jgi:hypothetical protein